MSFFKYRMHVVFIPLNNGHILITITYTVNLCDRYLEVLLYIHLHLGVFVALLFYYNQITLELIFERINLNIHTNIIYIL